MTRAIQITHVDVFTRSRLSGNAAAVVLDAGDLPAPVMQSIAREMNLSETAFVSDGPGDAVTVRFFSPTQEVPICGHATLASHFVRSRARGDTAGVVWQVSPGGRWQVRWAQRDGATFVLMTQGPIEYGATVDGEAKARLLHAFGATDQALVPNWPVQHLSTGHAKTVVPLASPHVLRGLSPNMDALRALSHDTGVGGYFCFALTDEPGFLTEARMFGPAIGVPEDPVNGSGHGPLGAYLAERSPHFARAVAAGFWSRMGARLGRPGEVWVQLSASGDGVDVGGFVTEVFTAQLSAGES